MSDIMRYLESNKKNEVEIAKAKLLDQFHYVRDPWLLNGLYEYYLSTNSANSIVILVSIKEPHHQYLFDRLADSIGKSLKSDVKVQALTLLGHVVRSHPTWLYKISEHHLLKDFLKLLKTEVEILPLISALLVLIVLIPMLPYCMGDNLDHIFEIFSRLASWNCNPGSTVEFQMIHMQVALYALFLRLYGMFPCNFLSYLRTQYKDKNRPVFIHTIKPMLETVKMNSSLVTTSKDNENTTERWKKKSVHDIIVECERFSLDVSDTYCPHDSCQLTSGFRSRSGTSNSVLEASYFQNLKNLAVSMSNSDRVGEYFTPSMGINQPLPMEAVNLTYVPQPEFTHDENIVPAAGSSPPEAAIEATPETTPILQENSHYIAMRAQVKPLISTSQPQSPVRKDKSAFHFPVDVKDESLPLGNKASVGSSIKLKSPPPTSPLKINTALGDVKKSPSRSLVNQDDLDRISPHPVLKQSDSVLHESEDSASENMDEDRSSPCTAGGLHMPNSKSMKDFAKRVQRLRHHSQCAAEPDSHDATSNGSPNDNGKVRRANSCPEMKKSPVSSIKDNVSRTLDETDEETNEERAESALSNGIDALSDISTHKSTIETQTDNLWPMPYEHLFLGIFPTLAADAKSSPAPLLSSEQGVQEARVVQPSIYEVLDKYVETAVQQDSEKEGLKNQLKLVHQQLLFERHRREKHAFKNRRFLADAKSTQVLEEHNSALRDQVQLQQSDIDTLRRQLEQFQRKKDINEKNFDSALVGLEEKCKSLEHQNKALREVEETLRKELDESLTKNLTLLREKQKTEALILDAHAELTIAKEQALAGQKGRAELEAANRQLLLIGELQLKYQERLDEVASLRRSDHEIELLQEAYNNETKTLKAHLKDKMTKQELYVTRISELEQLVGQKDEIIAQQKRILNTATEETEEKVKALNSLYQTQLAIARTMDEKLLELYRQIEQSTRKPIRSPDTSSCQEVQVSSDKISAAAALSERSSPLSCSFTSSDGSLALQQPDMRDAKSLQALVDEETPADVKHDILTECENLPSTSGAKK